MKKNQKLLLKMYLTLCKLYCFLSVNLFPISSFLRLQSIFYSNKITHLQIGKNIHCKKRITQSLNNFLRISLNFCRPKFHHCKPRVLLAKQVLIKKNISRTVCIEGKFSTTSFPSLVTILSPRSSKLAFFGDFALV